MKNGLVGYFGYGSLVNRETLRTEFVSCRPARLRGWRRRWQSRGSDIEPAHGQDVALLSVEPHAEGSILGMLVIDRREHLDHVDRREARYDRVPVEHHTLELLQGDAGTDVTDLPEEIFVYVGRAQPADESPPFLLQSYLDAVMAGFLREFGEAGLAHFLETTHGFERSMILDRGEPRYSRAVRVEAEIGERFDDLLRSAGVRFG